MPTVTGRATDFITFSRTSNATVTGADGRIRWAGHNLLTNSESFDASAWVKDQGGSTLPAVTANNAAAPNGTTTADKVDFGAIDAAGDYSFVYQSLTLAADGNYTAGIWVKAFAAGDVGKKIWLRMWNTATVGQIAVTLTADWQYASTSGALTAGGARRFDIVTLGSTFGGENQAAVSVLLWGAHLYRSDLGGMVLNPARGDAYYPTTPRNLAGFSEDFGNALWFKTGASVTSDAAIAPNGLQTADKLVEDGSTGEHRLRQTVNTVGGTRYTLSFYAKAAERNWVALNVVYPAVADNITYFNLTGSGSIGTNDPDNTASITSVGDGWYRCSVTHTTQSAQTSVLFIIYAASANNTISYAGVSGSGIFVWGAQLSDSASLDAYSPVYGAAVTSAAYYAPRLDYDPVTLAARGLLVEEQRTNVAQYSADLSSWFSEGSATFSSNVATAPDGTTTADKLVTANATATMGAGPPTFAFSATKYTWSAYLKAGEVTFAQFTFNTNITLEYANFDLSTGSVTAGTYDSASITPVGNGWYRCAITFTAQANTGRPFVLLISSGTAARSASIAGNGTNGLFVWGAQLEAGSFATSYIPNGSAVAGATRTADVASVSTQAFPYGATEGSFVVSGRSASASRDGKFLSITDGTANGQNNCFVLDVNPSGKTRFLVFASGSEQAGFTSSANYTPNSVVKIAGAYKQNDFGGTTNGEAITTDTTGNVPSVSVMEIGFHRFGSPLQWINGHIRQITYIPRRLSNSELQARTV